MKWFLDLLPLRLAATPASNPSDVLHVEPNARGGWSLRFDGDAPEHAIGNYPTAEDAARIARANVTNVQIHQPQLVPTT